MTKTALISGVSGQTGSLLAKRLLEHNYTVIGGSRDVSATDWWRFEHLGISNDVRRVSLAPNDLLSVLNAVKDFAPDEIYYLAGQSSVALSFSQPFEAFESIAVGALNFLEAIRLLDSPARFFNAASTDCFGDQSGQTLTEGSPMRPISPYGVSKAASYWTTANFRHSFGIHASNGILSNHESSLRGRAFVTQKIISVLKERKLQPEISLILGNTAVARDWLWAPEVAEAIHLITSADQPGDYIVASGQSHTLHDFVIEACRQLDLEPERAYDVDETFFRPHEIMSVELDPSKIRDTLGWSATTGFRELVTKLISGL